MNYVNLLKKNNLLAHLFDGERSSIYFVLQYRNHTTELMRASPDRNAANTVSLSITAYPSDRAII